MKKLWSDKKRQNAEKIISEILPFVKDSGIPYTPKITIARKELLASSDSKLNENLVLKALAKIKAENNVTLDEFEKIYSEMEIEWKRQHSI